MSKYVYSKNKFHYICGAQPHTSISSNFMCMLHLQYMYMYIIYTFSYTLNVTGYASGKISLFCAVGTCNVWGKPEQVIIHDVIHMIVLYTTQSECLCLHEPVM